MNTGGWIGDSVVVEVDVGAVVAGTLIYGSVLFSIAKTLVIPRGSLPKLAKIVDRSVDWIYGRVCAMTRSYERRDSIRSSQAVVFLFVMLVVWVATLMVALALMILPALRSPGGALREVGASFLTLGFTSTATPWATFVDFLAGFTGLAIVAVQISYLPTLYSAYNRRETEVTLLSSRVGEPAWGPELLARTRIGIVDAEVLGIYQAWERWAADVAESHSTYPVLLRFRSPNPYASWVTGLLCVMDSAALYLAVAPSRAPLSARLMLRMGFVCCRQIARSVGIVFDPDPHPDDPVALSFEEFLVGIDRLRSVGFPLERSLEEAWADFRGWRVNYESILYELAERLDAVPVRWSGGRRAMTMTLDSQRVVNRTPLHPDGESPQIYGPRQAQAKEAEATFDDESSDITGTNLD